MTGISLSLPYTLSIRDFFHVQHLSPQGQNRLKPAVTALLGGARPRNLPRRYRSLYRCCPGLNSPPAFARQGTALQRSFFWCSPGRALRPPRAWEAVMALSTTILATFGFSSKKSPSFSFTIFSTNGTDFAVAQLGFGLAFKLRLCDL